MFSPQAVPAQRIEFMNFLAVLVFAWLVSFAAVDPVRAQSDVPAVVRVPPLVDVLDFGTVGDGQADNTGAIQRAIDSMSGGGTLVFPAGNYVYTKQIFVSKQGVRLWGFDGAVLHASNPDHQAIRLSADATCIYGFTLTSTATNRASQLRHHRIVLESDGSEVVDNRIIGGAAAGISWVQLTSILCRDWDGEGEGAGGEGRGGEALRVGV